ncbi:SGNH/GDSL hydrolase family protein [Phycisphaera mikurensis]|uniref:SGNH/GDSL hydrolase family protein n=1 Tax=Phycisphaera mikurensis TaxID=547188 RepID=UPI0012B53C44|nr:SGNH/GDSL hydrolase family protein [Phycisphaera mikurensis]MBB6441777.1 hypothetical protein [Phycisphaera mikurensis]
MLLLAAAEACVRWFERSAWIPPPSSFDGLVNSRLAEMEGRDFADAFWLLGNSTLAEGLDAGEVARELGAPAWPLPHGSASLAGSMSLLRMYLDRLDSPLRVVIFVTVDDLNLHGLRAERSQKYLNYQPSRVPWVRENVRLVGNGPRVRQFLSGFAKSMLRGRFSLDFVVRKGTGTYDGRPIRDNDGNHDRLFRDFEPDLDSISALRRLSADAGLPPPVLVLMPVTDEHIRFRERFRPGWSYDAFRADLRRACVASGVVFVDVGEPLDRHAWFRDTYHLNDEGKARMSPEIGRRIAEALRLERHSGRTQAQADPNPGSRRQSS